MSAGLAEPDPDLLVAPLGSSLSTSPPEAPEEPDESPPVWFVGLDDEPHARKNSSEPPIAQTPPRQNISSLRLAILPPRNQSEIFRRQPPLKQKSHVRGGVEAIVVGMAAAVIQAAPTMTWDLDIAHLRTQDNVERLLGPGDIVACSSRALVASLSYLGRIRSCSRRLDLREHVRAHLRRVAVPKRSR